MVPLHFSPEIRSDDGFAVVIVDGLAVMVVDGLAVVIVAGLAVVVVADRCSQECWHLSQNLDLIVVVVVAAVAAAVFQNCLVFFVAQQTVAHIVGIGVGDVVVVAK